MSDAENEANAINQSKASYLKAEIKSDHLLFLLSQSKKNNCVSRKRVKERKRKMKKAGQ